MGDLVLLHISQPLPVLTRKLCASILQVTCQASNELRVIPRHGAKNKALRGFREGAWLVLRRERQMVSKAESQLSIACLLT
jgi:hypothetical protein